MILAGGLGRRMHPLTADCPKPLLPVGPWTLAEHQLASLARVGVDRVVLSTGYRHADFADLVSGVRAKGVDLTTVVEATPLGTGGGLRQALRVLGGSDAVLVLNGDLLTGHDIAAQVEHLRSAPADVVGVVHVREVPDARAYGSVVVGLEDRITDFVEKSASPPSRTVSAGTYVVRPALLERMPDEGPFSLEHDIFPSLAHDRGLLAHRDEAYFLDVGSPAALVTANRDLLLDPWPGAAPTPRGACLRMPGATVDPSARLVGGTIVHPGAVIAAGTHLESTVVLAGAHVGEGARVVRSVIGRDARVGTAARVTDSAIGTRELVGAGEHLASATRP